MSDESTVVSPDSEEREPEAHDAGATRSSAHDLGDVTDAEKVQNHEAQVGADGDAVDYYRFTLTQAREMRLGLWHREGDAELFLEDAEGTVLGRSVMYGNGKEAMVRTLGPGTYYVRVEAQGPEASAHQLKVRAMEPYEVYTFKGAVLAKLLGLPSFGEWRHEWSLSENADGSGEPMSLGTAWASDLDGDVLRYSLVGGNESGLFTIDATSGEVFYIGSGVDYESGAGPYELTVRASDGTHTIDATVTVTVADIPEAPVFTESSYEFELAENADGSGTRISLGTVSASDPDGATVGYSLVGGHESGRFAIDEASGEVFYAGSGEDHESVPSHELTVRASDGTSTTDTTVTVSVIDAPEAPAFAQASYEFILAENAVGSGTPVSLGMVSATDPDRGDTLRYSLVGGNESGRFTIDAASGEVFYAGSGEDFESGAGPYELTVRASDETLTVDATVTVTVTDVPEAPEFAQASYEFTLAENTDGSGTPISLGTVAATDPEGATVGYTLEGGNESGRFAIDASSGELFYAGPGEDYESVPSHALTVRASDGASSADIAVTVAVTDIRGDSESADADLPQDRTTPAVVLVDEGAVRGTIGSAQDRDWFAVDLVGGRTYQVDLRGRSTNDGTLIDPYLMGLYDADGRLIGGTTAPDGGIGFNSRLEFVAPRDGRYYIAATGNGYEYSGTGTYELEVSEVPAPVFAKASYGFTVAENADGSGTPISLGTVQATDPDGGTVRYSLVGGNDSGRFTIDETSGELVYTGPGEDFESEVTSHRLRVRASDGEHSTDTTVTVTVTDESEAPAFAASSYGFDLAENADGNETPVSLGTVQAADPDGDTLRYSLIGGNESGRFTIDETSGELSYVGTGEDFESEVTSHRLTLRASDDEHSTDTTITVTVTDESEAPAFAASSYGFDLAENADGNEAPVSLGTVQAADPDGDTLRYSLIGGNDSGRFTIDETSGELSYTGTGEDFEDGSGPYALTVRASDGEHSTDTTVTVTVTDESETSAFEKSSYLFRLAENFDGSVDRVPLGTVSATNPNGGTLSYSLVGGNESGRFVVDTENGDLFYVGAGEDREGGVSSYELTVRVSDGTHTADTTVTITVVEPDPGPDETADPQGSSEPAGEDLPAGRSTKGEVLVDAEPVEGTLRSSNDRDWFAVTLAPSRTYAFNIESDAPNSVTAPVIRGLRDSNGNPVQGIGDGPEVRYTTGETGTEAVYYVEVGGPGNPGQGTSLARGLGTRSIGVAPLGSNDGGSYRLWGCDITETRYADDDFAADTTTTGVVVVGAGSVAGVIERPGDRDWFAVALEEGKSYRIDLEGSYTSGGTLRIPYLRGVHNSEGNLISGTTNRDDGGLGSNSRVVFDAEATGTHYIAAGAYRNLTGTYSLSVTEIGDDEYSAGTDTTGTVVVGSTKSGDIERPGDRDWFAVTLEAGTQYRIDIEGWYVAAGTLWDPYLYGIHDMNGNLIAGTARDNWGVSRNVRVFFTPDTDSTYYIAVGGAGARTGTYRVTVKEVTDDYTNDTDTTGLVTVGSSATGEIDFKGDRDWLAVTLEADTHYRIELKGHRYGHGTLQDPYIRGVHDSDGNLMPRTTDDNSAGGHNSRAWVTAKTDGTYYIAVGADDSRPDLYNETGTYRLFVTKHSSRTTETPDDYSEDTSTTGEVSVNGSVVGVHEWAGDRDWFEVELEADKEYRFEQMRFWGTRNQYLHAVYDSEGNVAGGTIDRLSTFYGTNYLFFTPEVDGTYYIATGVGRLGGWWGNSGRTYRLSVIENVDDYTADTATAGRVAVGGSATGNIEAHGDRDWFAVTLDEGATYRIDLKGWATRSGSLWNPLLDGVHDSSGNKIDGTSNDTGGVGLNSQVHFTAPEDATYYVSAAATGPVHYGTYTLSVEEVTDGM